jgi:hypothetical protein
MTDGEVTVQLVNLDPVEGRTVVVQGGAYAEHRILAVEDEGRSVPVEAPHFGLCLAPGSGCRLRIGMRRYAHPPTFAFPWDRDRRDLASNGGRG